MALDRLTKITGPGIKTDTNWVGNNANFTGITTTGSSFNVGVTTIHSNLAEVHNIKSTGIITATGGSFSGNVSAVDGSFSGNVTAVDGTFSGNVSIAGTLTYEDVTNIDSVGIITAPALDVDDFINVGSNIHLGNAGVITATSFVGSGSGLTGVASTDNIITGTAATFTGGVDINSDLDVDGHTNLDNVSIAGVTTHQGLFKLPDSTNNQTGRLMLGTGTDLQIFHTGSAGEIGNFTGNLNVKTNSFRLFNGGANQLYIKADQNDSVILYHSNNEKFRTTAQGIEVTGHSELDNVNIAGVSTFTGAVNATNAVVGDFIDVGNNIKIGNAGVVTATSFVGDGSGLTGLVSDKIFEGNTKAEVVDTGSNGYFIVETEGTERFRLDNVGDATFTGNLYIPDELVHSGDTNTRIRFPATDTFSVETAGTERLRITSAGKFGFNTNNPTGTLSIASGTFQTTTPHYTGDDIVISGSNSLGISFLTLASGTSNNNIYFGDTDDTDIGMIRYAHADNSMQFRTNTEERLRIGSDGAILVSNSTGIGIGAATNGSSSYPSVTISGTSGGAIHFEDDGDLLADIYGSSSGLTFSTRKVTDAIIFQTNSGLVTEKVRITSDGKVGINQTSPQRILHVGESGTAEANIRIQGGSDYGEIRVKDSDNELSFHHNVGGAGSRELFSANGSTGHFSINCYTYQALTITTNENGTNGPELSLFHNSASPAASDSIAQIRFNAKDSAGNTDLYARIHANLASPTSGSESGDLVFSTRGSGSFAEKLRITSGGKVQLPTANSTNTYLNVKNIGISRISTSERLAITDIGAVAYDYELDDIMVYRSAGYWSGIDNPRRRGRIRTQNLRVALNFDIGHNPQDNALLAATVFHNLDYGSSFAISGSVASTLRTSSGLDNGPYWNRQMAGGNVDSNFIVADLGGNATTQEVSLCCWYKSQSNDSEGTGSGGQYGPAIALFGDTRGSVWGGFGITSRKPDFSSNGGVHNIATSAPSVVDGNWHHIVFTYDGPNADLKIYVDGTLYLTNNSVSCSTNTRYDRIAGHYNYTYTHYPFNMANVLIYDRIISANDVKGIYYARTFYRDTI